MGIDIYSKGLIHCSVCSNLSSDETVAEVNKQNPTGIESQWEISKEDFKGGEPNPSPCDKGGKSKHYLMVC